MNPNSANNFLLPSTRLSLPSINWLWQQLSVGKIDFSSRPSHLCYRVVRRIIDLYRPIILGIESRLDKTDELILNFPNDNLLDEMSTNNYGLIDQAYRHEFAFEQVEQLASLSNLFQEFAVDLINGYISLTSHRLNQIIKVLTIVTVVFLPLTLIASNFQNIPELSSERGTSSS